MGNIMNTEHISKIPNTCILIISGIPKKSSDITTVNVIPSEIKNTIKSIKYPLNLAENC